MGWPELNEVSEVTRRSAFDALRIGAWEWCGRLDEVDFLNRLFDLGSLPSYDSRHKDMGGDIWRHRVMNPEDWSDDWVFSDGRLNLLHGPDEVFLRFLCETVHPVVRPDDDAVTELVALYNRYLAADGFTLSVMDIISGKRLFAAVRTFAGAGASVGEARKVADELSSAHVSAQITRMQDNITKDPALAIGSAKEFVESLCKGILDARSVVRTGKEEFTPLVTMVRDALGLRVNPKSDVTLRSMLGALGTITNSLAELRGQVGTGHGNTPDTAQPPAEVARLAVGVATALGVFLWETHRALSLPQPSFQPC